MKTEIWMPFYVADYLRDTMHLTTEQHGAYVLLIIHYWATRGPLPDDDAYLSSVAKLMANAWQTHRQTLGKFFDIADGQWRHKRIDLEIERAKANKSARSKAGKLGANGKWHGKTMANAWQTVWQNDGPSPSPSELNIYTGPVEPLPGFPKTVQEAIAGAMAIGCPDDFVEATWNKAMSRGGRDAKDIPIRKWSSFIATEWAYNKNRVEREKQAASVKPSVNKPTSPSSDFWKDTKALELIDAEIKAIENRLSRDAFGYTFENDQQREKFNRLRKQRKELKTKLGLQ